MSAIGQRLARYFRWSLLAGLIVGLGAGGFAITERTGDSLVSVRMIEKKVREEFPYPTSPPPSERIGSEAQRMIEQESFVSFETLDREWTDVALPNIVPPNWQRIEALISELVSNNRDAIRGWAMTNYPVEDPLRVAGDRDRRPWADSDWTARKLMASVPLEIETTSGKLSLVALTSLYYALCATALIFCLTILLSVAWIFFLDRLSEVSAAVRGTRE